jgi:hypothetical protein
MFNNLKKLFSFLFIAIGLFLFAQIGFAQDVGMEFGDQIGLGSEDPRVIASNIIRIFLGFLGIVALGLIIYAGFLWMTSEGNAEKVDKAKKILTGAIIGLLIILSAFAIASFIISQLLDATQGTGGGDGNGGGGPPISNIGGGGSSCDSNTLTDVCEADNNMCGEDEYCEETSCTCQSSGGMGDPCDADTATSECDADNDMCGSYLECQPEADCTCQGAPVIYSVTPIGGFCQNDINTFCESDEDCSDSSCATSTPNGAPGNLVSLTGQYFGTTTGSVHFSDGDGFGAEALRPSEENPDCDDSWNTNQIIVVVPDDASQGPIRVTRNDGETDTTDNDRGNDIPDFVVNDIERPGLCKLEPTSGRAEDELAYYGLNLLNSTAYFGNNDSSDQAQSSSFTSPLEGTGQVPLISAGDTTTFVAKNSKGSNFLKFTKLEEPAGGPVINYFEPTKGPPGKYVTIYGQGFGNSQAGQTVYFGDAETGFEAGFDFPKVCGDSVWTNDQVIVKVPPDIPNGQYLITMELNNGVVNSSQVVPTADHAPYFQVDDSLPLTPGLCKIKPVMGPNMIPIQLWGEYFGAEEGTIKFYHDIIQSNIEYWGEDEQYEDAERVDTIVSENAISGPVQVVDNNDKESNGMNYEVGNCNKADSPDDACDAQVCCPVGSYKEGRCMDEISECSINIPNSVYEWEFDTGGLGGEGDPCFIDAETTPNCNSVNGPCGPGLECGPDSCVCEPKETPYDSCQQRSQAEGNCDPVLCPNSPGECSANPSSQSMLKDCDLSCNSVEGCEGDKCYYSYEFNQCVLNDLDCDLEVSSEEVLAGEKKTYTKYCDLHQDKPLWHINTQKSCPEGWTNVGEGVCIDTSSSCQICKNGKCKDDKDGDNKGVCTVGSQMCPPDSDCNYAIKVTQNSKTNWFLPTYSTKESGADFYNYNPSQSSSEMVKKNIVQSDRSEIFVHYSQNKGRYSVGFIHDAQDDGDGGSVYFDFSKITSGNVLGVEDDPGDEGFVIGDEILAGDSWSWGWAPCCTDGGLIEMPEGNWSITIDPKKMNGIEEWAFSYMDTKDGYFSLAKDSPVTISYTSQTKCFTEKKSKCECCCRIGQGSQDCCSFQVPDGYSVPDSFSIGEDGYLSLMCGGNCGSDASGEDTDTYGNCSGCRIEDENGNVDQGLSDQACNCSHTAGQYCDVEADPDNDGEPEGVCRDCATLSGEDSCTDHQTTCCVDAMNNNNCRGGEGETGLTNASEPDVGYCGYYQCTESGNSCDAGNNPVASTSNEFYASSTTCMAECVPGPQFGQTCAYTSTATNECNTEICPAPFGCMNEDGTGASSPPQCGICCCDPDASPDPCTKLTVDNQLLIDNPYLQETTNTLTCKPDKGNCTGEQRGLCCGCEQDVDCASGEPTGVGCGSDTCCHSRPAVDTVAPADENTKVCANVQILAEFDQQMSVSSFTGNMIVAGQYDGPCPEGTTYVADAGGRNTQIAFPDNQILSFFYNLNNNVRSFFNRVGRRFSSLWQGEEVLASFPLHSDKNYCAVKGAVSGRHTTAGVTEIIFTPSQLLDTNRKYFVIIQGDKDLDSGSGVLSRWGVGMNGGSSPTLNGVTYKHSYIWSFETMKDQGNNGACAIDRVRINPSSYLFQTVKDDLNENDSDPNATDNSFDTVRDRDKVFTAEPLSKDGAVLVPVDGYNWNWNWTIDNPAVVDMDPVSPFSSSDNRQLIQAQDDQTNAGTKVRAKVELEDTDYSSEGDGEEGVSEVWVFLCDNPWPAIQEDGTWSPWEDEQNNCTAGDTDLCPPMNFETYYCRDQGNESTVDDLPAITGGKVRYCDFPPGGDSCSSILSAGAELPTDAILKEIFFFHEEVPQAKDLKFNSVESLPAGGGVKLKWTWSGDPVDHYKIYYDTSSGRPYNYSVTTEDDFTGPLTIKGLTNGQTYYFTATAVYESGAESDYSKEKSVEIKDIEAPEKPAINNVSVQDGNIKVNWSDQSGGDAVSFTVYYTASDSCSPSLDFGGSITEPYSETATTTITGLSSGISYCVGVSAMDESGNESNITPAESSVVF